MPKQSKLPNFTEPRINYNSGNVLQIAKWKREVVKRDKNKCQNCFDSIQDGFRNRKFPHEAHHIVPRHHGGGGKYIKQRSHIVQVLPPVL